MSYHCKGCGKFISRAKWVRLGVCDSTCASLLVMRVSREMVNKEGPYYDRWVRGMKQHAESLIEREVKD